MPVYDKILKKINHPKNIYLLNSIAEIVSQHSKSVVNNFYSEMLNNPQAAGFLTHEEVKQHLSFTLANWLREAFLYRPDPQSIEDYRNYQFKIGKIHAKIGLPISLVNYGMHLIKEDVAELLIASPLERQDLGQALLLMTQILDCALQIMNESYECDLVVNEKDSQALKLQFSTHHLAFDCERLRTSLSDWMRELLLNMQQNLSDIEHSLTIRQSNFGLWVTHKASLLLANRSELTTLLQLLEELDKTTSTLAQHLTDEPQKQQSLKQLNKLISQANWVLGEVAREIIEQDSGRDCLTRLFNRRYLETVMRYETASSLKSGRTFGVIIVDIDFFKKINDSYGHDNGDRVLEQLANILVHEVRAGDFVFRLGGEEFLIVLGDVNHKVLKNIAEKIRAHVAETVFMLGNNQDLAVTVSIGTALHDGHPDFHRTVKFADQALYKAKESGRNRVVTSE